MRSKVLAVSEVATSVTIDWLATVPLVELLPSKLTVLVLAVQPANASMSELGVKRSSAEPSLVAIAVSALLYQPANV